MKSRNGKMGEFWLMWQRSKNLSEKKLKTQFGGGDLQALELNVWEEKLPFEQLGVIRLDFIF